MSVTVVSIKDSKVLRCSRRELVRSRVVFDVSLKSIIKVAFGVYLGVQLSINRASLVIGFLSASSLRPLRLCGVVGCAYLKTQRRSERRGHAEKCPLSHSTNEKLSDIIPSHLLTYERFKSNADAAAISATQTATPGNTAVLSTRRFL